MTAEAQRAYRAELEAVHHAALSPNQATHIVSDCKSIVEQMRSLMHRDVEEESKPEGDHEDLWVKIQQRIDEKPQGFFEVSWIASHLEAGEARRIEARGGFLARRIWGNDHADAMAKQAITHHDINWREHDKAEERIFLACTIQTMIKKVWGRYFCRRHERQPCSRF